MRNILNIFLCICEVCKAEKHISRHYAHVRRPIVGRQFLNGYEGNELKKIIKTIELLNIYICFDYIVVGLMIIKLL